MLESHPNIGMSVGAQETHFLDCHFHKGLDWYAAHFPFDGKIDKRGIRTLAGDCTPIYLFHPLVPERASNTIPNARFVVLLRDPVERTLSHYFHCLKRGHEHLKLDDALAAEEGRLSGEVERMLADPGYYSIPYRRFSYCMRGVYHEQIARWQNFFPKESFLFLRSDMLSSSPIEALQQICDFLELPTMEPPSDMRRNVGAWSDVPDSTIEMLIQKFKEPNRHLAEMIGPDFNFNERPGPLLLRRFGDIFSK